MLVNYKILLFLNQHINNMYTSKILYFVFFTLCIADSIAQESIITATGIATVDFPEYKSRIEVEKQVQDLAITDALERAFGRVIIQGNSTYIKNVNTGQQTKTFSTFNMIGNSYVKGEVLEILDKTFKEKIGKKIIDNQQKEYKELECTIKIKAREITEAPININASPIKYPNKYAKTNEFHDGDTLYLYFYSEESGYLSIYFDDNQYSYCLLPYRNIPEEYKGGIPIAAGKDYILFSDKYNRQYFRDLLAFQDTYILTTNEIFEMDRLFVIFSKDPLNKPVFKDNIDEEKINEIKKEQGFSLPDGLKSEDFQRWLMKNRSIRKDVQITYVDITIIK